MSRPLALRPEALDEFENATAWYEAQRPGLGLEFMADIERLLARIGENAEMFARWSELDPSRKALATRFPYAVFFDVEADRVLVLAVAHVRRHPGYWVGRIPRP